MNTYDPEKVIVYCQGTFNEIEDQDVLTTKAQALGASSFGTVILGFWHVSALGSISYGDPKYSYYVAPNDRPEYKLVDLDWMLTNVPKYLKAAGNVTKVLLSFGGGGAGDLNGIKLNLDTFQGKLTDLLTDYPDLDGVDYDFEKYQDDDHTQTLVSIVGTVSGLNKTVTAAPYGTNDPETDDDFMPWWLDVLAKTQGLPGGGFTWWNLQSAQSNYEQWKEGVAKCFANNSDTGESGSTDADASAAAESFLTWDYSNGNDTAANVTSTLQKQKVTYPALAGAYIWDFEGLYGKGTNSQVDKYAKAVITGLTVPASATAGQAA